MRALTLHTSDGHALTADMIEPDISPRAGIVVCHPHPLYGGDRFHPVVDALFRRAPTAGYRAVRFDFRSAHDGGTAERLDVVAALDAVGAADGDGLALFVLGYSFGAVVALSVDDPRIAGVVAIAPPLAAAARATPPTPNRPVLVLTPRHDQFCPPEVAEPIVSAWPSASFDVIERADHFLAGAGAAVTDRAYVWLAG